MSFKKRRMMLIPEVNSKSFVFFFERGNSGTSWSIRDYSIRNRVKEYGPPNFRWNAEEIHQKAQHSLDAPTHSTDDLAFWHEHTQDCNRRFLGETPPSVAAALPTKAPTAAVPATPEPSKAFPVLDLPRLLNLPKGRKTQDMDRILYSPNSEDWVTWNFFQVMLRQYPSGWWGHILSGARRRKLNLSFITDDRSLPTPRFWSLVRCPSEYEMQSRGRMLASGNAAWAARAAAPDPVEGASEIDVVFDHDDYLVYAEAKLGSDVSMSTTYDPMRNQIIRNIDCLIESAGARTPIFWMLVKDEEQGRAYVQLMTAYKADPGLLIRELPHRDPDTLKRVAQNLTTLRWDDFRELVAGPGSDADMTAVKQELGRRI